ncbi:MAG: hypothetical protein NTW30_02470 [Candidatus Aenigmarchaeota archaeon]|nr:hypothetical protein [Candidatus Aenigmarchaeota archaeon]
MRRYDFTKNMKGRGKKIQEVLNWEGALEKQLEESFRMDSTG